jgi:hypothetical protein
MSQLKSNRLYVWSVRLGVWSVWAVLVGQASLRVPFGQVTGAEDMGRWSVAMVSMFVASLLLTWLTFLPFGKRGRSMTFVSPVPLAMPRVGRRRRRRP